MIRDVEDEGGTLTVLTVGLVLLAANVWYLHVYDVIADEGPLTTFPELFESINILVAGTSIALLLYGAVWLRRTDLPEEENWRVGVWCAAAFVGSAAVVAFLQVHWLLDGVAPPRQWLVEQYLVAVGVGAVGGLLVGVNDARRVQSRRTVATQRDAFAVVNEFLRHQVLNGMQVVVGYTDLLAAHVDEDHREYVEGIDERGEDITALVRRVNVMMRSISGETELGAVELAPVVEAEVAAAREQYPETTFETSDLPDVAVRADQLLEEVVGELLGNAAVHNDADDPRVDVAVRVSDQAATLSVADNGSGVPDERKGRVFDPGEEGPRKVGRGFGLYLVDVLVERYGGAVGVADNDPHGAVFEVELPIA